MLIAEHEQIGIINHKVGDTVNEYFHVSGVVNTDHKKIKGKVVYVHPLGRYYTVEFDFHGNKVRESYTVRSDINPQILHW